MLFDSEDSSLPEHCPPAVKICDARPRRRLAVEGEVLTSIVTRIGTAIACRIEISDGTGALAAVFFGRRAVPGLVPGRSVRVVGRALPDRSPVVLWNPRYEILPEVGDVTLDPSPGPGATLWEPLLDAASCV